MYTLSSTLNTSVKVSQCVNLWTESSNTSGMSGETEIEVSVVSEEDLELETSRSSPAPGEMLLQESKSGKPGCLASTNPFGFEVSKALRPACNPQYTSFSISSILGRTESPPSDSASAGRASPLPNHHHHHQGQRCGSPGPRILSPRLLAGRPTTTSGDAGVPLGPGITTSSAGVLGGAFAATDANNSLISHQASADLTMLSR